MKQKNAPLIVPEQRILFYLYAFGWGIGWFHMLPTAWHQSDQLIAAFTMVIIGVGAGLSLIILLVLMWRLFKPNLSLNTGITNVAVINISIIAGFVMAGVIGAGWQFILHDPPKITRGITVNLSGTLIAVDGQADQRSRLWVRLDKVPKGHASHGLERASIVRVTPDEWYDQAVIGDHISTRARLYPPPGRMLAGTPDFSRRARTSDVSASGFIVADITVRAQINAHSSYRQSWTVALARLRADFATRLTQLMPGPEGGVAAAWRLTLLHCSVLVFS